MWWLAIALAACRFAAVAEHAPCPAPQVWPSQLDDVAFDDTLQCERRLLDVIDRYAGRHRVDGYAHD